MKMYKFRYGQTSISDAIEDAKESIQFLIHGPRVSRLKDTEKQFTLLCKKLEN